MNIFTCTVILLTCCLITRVLANETDNKPETENVVQSVIKMLTSGKHGSTSGKQETTSGERETSSDEQENSEEEWNSYATGPRIVGGDDAIRGEFPWQVSLHEFGYFFCGGSIINPTTILTAEHCLMFPPSLYKYIQVRAGTHRRNQKDRKEQRRTVEDIIFHSSPEADIAIIKVSSPFNFNNFVQPIRLANSSTEPGLFQLKQCTASGFGQIEYPDNPLPTVLQKVNSTLRGRAFCKRLARRYHPEHRYRLSEICTNDKNYGACYGDSGGPLVCYDDENMPHLVGVLSWGSTDCWLGYNVYARTSRYLTWIEQNSS